MKLYRFFYHYNKHNNKMTIHFRNKCFIVKDVDCKVPSETKWNKTQPQLVMRGHCKEVMIENDKGIIK